MNCFLCIILPACLLALASATSSDVKVVVYNGPKKCSNKNIKKDEKPTRIEPDYIAALHFTVTIDESSTGARDTIGKKIESSRDMGIAPSFPVGQGKVILGLDQGLIGLCKGASAYIVVPPHLGYGRMGKPEQGVYGDTTLRYDVEIIDVQPPVPNDFVKIDSNKDWKISKSEAKQYFEGLGQPIDLDSLWGAEDKDKDGYISWEEFSGPKGGEEPPKQQPKQKPKQQQQQQQQQQQRTKEQQQADKIKEVGTLFQNLDVDKDGKLNKEELSNTFKLIGQEMPEEFWAESDPDGDGFVTYEEFIGSDDDEKKAGSKEEL